MEDTPSIEHRVGEALRATDATVALAESCTGGLACSRLTDVPGSSEYVDRGFVTYSYAAKREMLGVSREALDEHGAVSAPVAAEMARAARDMTGTTWGVSITGIAGPDGGSPSKPVGTVYIGVAYAGGWGTGTSYVTVSHYRFEGTRSMTKRKAVTQALTDLIGEIRRDDESL